MKYFNVKKRDPSGISSGSVEENMKTRVKMPIENAC